MLLAGGDRSRGIYIYIYRERERERKRERDVNYILYGCWWLLLYSAILCSQADSLCSHVILHEWLAFYRAFLISASGVLTALAWLVPHETAAISAQVLCTPDHTTMHHVTSCEATYVRCMLIIILTFLWQLLCSVCWDLYVPSATQTWQQSAVNNPL